MAAEKTVEKSSKRRRRGNKDEAAQDSTLSEGKGRATPGRRSSSSGGGGGNFLTRPFVGMFEYLSEVRSELDKVTWPTREETIRLTRIVLLATVASALVLGFISIVLGEYIRIGLSFPILFVITFALMIGGALYYMRRGSSGKGY